MCHAAKCLPRVPMFVGSRSIRSKCRQQMEDGLWHAHQISMVRVPPCTIGGMRSCMHQHTMRPNALDCTAGKPKLLARKADHVLALPTVRVDQRPQ